MIRVRAIGATDVEINGKRLSARSGVAFALAAYLCVRAGDRVSRAQLAALFWPDKAEAKGRHNLRQILYRLRSYGFPVQEDAEEVTLDPEFVDADVRGVLDPKWPERDSEFRIGPDAAFLPQLKSDISEPFRLWLDATRAKVTSQISRRLLRQIECARQEGRWGDMLSLADVVLRVDPLNEEATLAKAECFAMSGAKSTAVRLIDEFVSELGPHASKISLPASVLKRRISERSSNWGPRSSRETPLVGRELLVARLSKLLTAANEGHGSGTILTGPPGVGKTRLAMELRAIAELRGFRCVEVRVDPTNTSRPFGLASTLAGALRDLPGTAGSSPQALAVVRRLTLTGGSAAPLEIDPAGALSGPQLVWALVEVVSAISAETRLLLTVDDIHNADAGSAELLAAVVAASQSLRVAVLMTSRPSTPSAPTLIDLSPVAIRLSVPPLGTDASLAFASYIAEGLGRKPTDDVLSRIVSAAGGNPLFLRELTTYHDGAAPEAVVPPSLVLLIEARLSQLPHAHLRVLRLAAVLESFATVRLLREITRDSRLPFPLSSVLEDLERDGIVSGTSDGVLLVHDCWRTSVTSGTGPATRAAIALECAEALLRDDSNTDAVDVRWWAANLYVTAGSDADARNCLVAAGETLLSKGLARQAVAAFDRSLALTRDDATRVRVLELVARAYGAASEYEDAIKYARDGLTLASVAHPHCAGTRLQLLSTLADALFRVGQPHDEVLLELAAAVEIPHLPQSVRHSACLTGMRLVFIANASPVAERLDRVIADSTSSDGPTLPGELGRIIFAAECGTADEVRARCVSLERVSTDGYPATMRARALRFQATALRFIGEIESCLRHYESALDLSLRAGDFVEAHTCSTLIAFCGLDWGDHAAAAAAFKRSQEIGSFSRISFQQRQSWHLEGRMLLQTGRIVECLASCESAVAITRSDTMARRQIADSACIGLAAAYVGDNKLALEMMAITSKAIDADRPSAQNDFPSEALVRFKAWSSGEDEARDVAQAYLRRRRELYDRPIPRGFSMLRFFAAQMSSADATFQPSAWDLQLHERAGGSLAASRDTSESSDADAKKLSPSVDGSRKLGTL